MAVNKLDPKTIFASEAPTQDTPAVFNNRTLGWGESRKNGGRPTIKQMNALQQDTDLKILWLNENSVTPFDATIDYPVNAITIKDGVLQQNKGGVWVSIGSQELKEYLLAVGVDEPNLDTEYTYVMDHLAQIAVDKGWTAELVVDGDQNQKQINTINSNKYVSVLDFDITGDGSDESSKFNLAMNRARSRSVPLDLAGLFINVGSELLDIDVKVKNGKLKGRFQFTKTVNLESVDFEVMGAQSFYLKGTEAQPIQNPKLENVKIKYGAGVTVATAYSLYAEYCNNLQIIGGEYNVIQLIRCPNYKIVRAVIDGNMVNTNELIHASYKSTNGFIAFNTFKNALDNVLDLYSSGEGTRFVYNTIENCGNRLGTVIELKCTYSDDPNNSSNNNLGFCRNILIHGNIFKNTKVTNAVPSSIIAIYSIDSRETPLMTSSDFISDIIVSENIFDGYDTSSISSNIRAVLINVGRANNVKIRGNIAKNINNNQLLDTSAFIGLFETNNCEVTNNSGCINESVSLLLNGTHRKLLVSENHFDKDEVSGHKPKFAVYTTTVLSTYPTTTIIESKVTDNFLAGSISSVRTTSATVIDSDIAFNTCENKVELGLCTRSVFDFNRIKITNSDTTGFNIFSNSQSLLNSGKNITVVGTGSSRGMYLYNVGKSDFSNMRGDGLATLYRVDEYAELLKLDNPTSTNSATLWDIGSTVSTTDLLTIGRAGLTAIKYVDSSFSVPSKGESRVYITGASGFRLGMELVTSYSVYANGVVFNAVVTSANTIEVHIINNTDASVTVPVGVIKVRSV